MDFGNRQIPIVDQQCHCLCMYYCIFTNTSDVEFFNASLVFAYICFVFPKTLSSQHDVVFIVLQYAFKNHRDMPETPYPLIK